MCFIWQHKIDLKILGGWLSYTHVGEAAAGLAVAALPAIGGHGEDTTKIAKREPAVLSERDQKLVAILAKMTVETMEQDREAMLTLVLG